MYYTSVLSISCFGQFFLLLDRYGHSVQRATDIASDWDLNSFWGWSLFARIRLEKMRMYYYLTVLLASTC